MRNAELKNIKIFTTITVIVAIVVLLFSGCDKSIDEMEKIENEKIEINTTNGKYSPLTESVVESEFPGNDSEKLAQYKDSEGNVYISKQYKLCSDNEDVISITYKEDAYGFVTKTEVALKINESSTMFYITKFSGIDIADLNDSDNLKEIFVYGDTPTSGKYILVFTYDGNQIYNMGKLNADEYNGILKDNDGNFMDKSTYIDFIEPFIVTAHFNIKDYKFDRVEIDYSEMLKKKYTASYDLTISFRETVFEDIVTGTEFDKNNVSYIKSSEEFELIKANTKDGLYCVILKDGRKGIFTTKL